jgi:hypothetical protein
VTTYRRWRKAKFNGATIYLSNHPSNDEKYGLCLAGQRARQRINNTKKRALIIERLRAAGGIGTVRDIFPDGPVSERRMAIHLLRYNTKFFRRVEPITVGHGNLSVWELIT